MKKRIVSTLILLAACANAMTVEDVITIEGRPAGGTYALTVFTAPKVAADGYAVSGEVRYDDVQGQAYLEMWSVFADGSRYFSRTLAAGGPQGILTGTSDWRPFGLPFYLNGAAAPERLEINAVLPGPGTVSVRTVRLGGLDTLPHVGWWSDRAAGLVGAIGGSLIGIFGALMGWLVSKRRARNFTLSAMAVATALGAALLVAGLVALATSQPYSTWFPLLLAGAILVPVFGLNRRTAQRAYAEAELRRMQALDR
jgi:hypothetical protein